MKRLKLSGSMRIVDIGPNAEAIIEFRRRMEARLKAAGVQQPPMESFEDPVDYNNRLLELAEEAEGKR